MRWSRRGEERPQGNHQLLGGVRSLEKGLRRRHFYGGRDGAPASERTVTHASRDVPGPRITTIKNVLIEPAAESSAMAVFSAPIPVLRDVMN
jgi:hypothetical protein